MEQIRVCTHEGPGAKPVIRTVPWPDVSKKCGSDQGRCLRRLRH